MKHYTAKLSRICNVLNPKNLTMKQLQAELGCDFIHAAHWWHTSSPPKPLGNYKVDGKIISTDQWLGMVYGWAWNDGEMPVMTLDINAKDNFVCTMPLIVDGKPIELYPDAYIAQAHSRPASGIDAQGNYHLVLFDKQTPWEVQAHMLSLGCVNAMMWDGGGSTKASTPEWTQDTSRVLQNYMCGWVDDGGDNGTGEHSSPLQPPDKEGATVKKKKVCLDPGHGGTDYANGSPDGKYKEHEFTLDMAFRIEAHLLRCGVEVMLTRRVDMTMALNKRAAAANSWGADVFVSLHSNACGKSYRDAEGWGTASGLCVFTCGAGEQLARNKLARAMLNRFEAAGVEKHGAGLFYDRFTVLTASYMPAVLIEYLFHTNKADVEKLNNDGYREMLAECTARGICEHLGVAWVPEKEGEKPVERTLDERVTELEKRVAELERSK